MKLDAKRAGARFVALRAVISTFVGAGPANAAMVQVPVATIGNFGVASEPPAAIIADYGRSYSRRAATRGTVRPED